MNHSRAIAILILLLGLLPLGPLAAQNQVAKDRAEALANSPAKQRLDQIQQYKPVIRRSRSLVIQEMEQDIAAAYIKLDAGETVIRKQERLAKKGDPKAWPPEQIAETKVKMAALEAYLEEAEEYLAQAKAEHARVLELLARERSAHTIVEDEEFDEEEEEGNTTLSIPAAPKPAKTENARQGQEEEDEDDED